MFAFLERPLKSLFVLTLGALISLLFSLVGASVQAWDGVGAPTVSRDSPHIITTSGGWVEDILKAKSGRFESYQQSGKDYNLEKKQIFFKRVGNTDTYVANFYDFFNTQADPYCLPALVVKEGTPPLAVVSGVVNENLDWEAGGNLGVSKPSASECAKKMQSYNKWAGSFSIAGVIQGGDTVNGFLGFTITPCQKSDTSCINTRNSNINSAEKAIVCTTASPSAIRDCNEKKSVIQCLRDDVTKSVSDCNDNYLADDILEGNTEGIYANTSDERIEEICSHLSSKESRETCIKNAKEARDKKQCEADPTREGCSEIDPEASSCVIEGIGWLICPVFKFLGGVADGTYGLIRGFLVTDVKVLDTDSGTFRAWEIMRNISNVGLVIAILLIIFSQLSSVGVSNYGVKKMLPRLIIVAIVINLSFIISQLAIDISNILGVSLHQFLGNIQTFDQSLSGDKFATSTPFSDITTGILAGTAIAATGAVAIASVAFAGPGLLLPVLGAGVLAVILTIFVLIARQAIIILLVVVAPLALLALLFPNTENLFKQWRKIFISMLVIFPAIALLFGASRLASGVLIQSLGDAVLGPLAALAVMVLPLFAIPSIVKGSLNAIPFIGNLASAAMSRSGGLLKRTGGVAAQNSWGGKYLDYRRREAERKRALTISGSGTGLRSRLNKRFNNSKYSGQFGDRLITQGIKTADTIQDEHIADRALRMQGDYDPGELVAGASRELSEAIRQGDIIRARAAQHILGTQTGARGLDELHNVYSRDMNKEEVVKSDIGTSLRRGLGAIPGLKGRDAVLDAFKHHDIAKNGFVTVKEIAKDPRTYAGLSPEELAAQSVTQLKEGQATITREMAKAVLTTEEAKKYLSDEKRRLFESKV